MSRDQEQRDREQRPRLGSIADEIQAERRRGNGRGHRRQRRYPEQQCEGEPYAKERHSERYRKREGDACRRRDSLASRKAMEYRIDRPRRPQGCGFGGKPVRPSSRPADARDLPPRSIEQSPARAARRRLWASAQNVAPRGFRIRAAGRAARRMLTTTAKDTDGRGTPPLANGKVATTDSSTCALSDGQC